jgi:dipeptidyl aminopeptidase/acylaminoacyl peptidase
MAHPDTVVRDVARLLGMSGSDLHGRAAGWANEREDMFVFFVTFPGRPDAVLVRRDDKLKQRIYWRIQDGAFSTTVLDQDGKVAVVSGEVYDKGGREILNLFYRASQTN